MTQEAYHTTHREYHDAAHEERADCKNDVLDRRLVVWYENHQDDEEKQNEVDTAV